MQNYDKPDGLACEAGYYYNDVKVCVFPIDGVGIANATGGKGSSITLNGINGTIKMVIADPEKYKIKKDPYGLEKKTGIYKP